MPRRKSDGAEKRPEPRPGETARTPEGKGIVPLPAGGKPAADPQSRLEERNSKDESPVRTDAKRRRFLETALDGVLILDGATGAITDANPFVAELLGFSHEELLGKTLWELGLPKDADPAKRAFRRLLAKRYLQPEDLFLVVKGGLPVGVEVSGIIYRVNGEDVVQCNVRRRKEAGKLEASLKTAQSAEGVSQYVGGVAHDFNHLMAVILGYCEALESQAALPEPARKMILEIHSAGVSARNLTQRLLAINGGQEPQPVALDLNQAVVRMTKMLGRLFGEKVQLACSLAEGLGMIGADPSQIDQVLLNLVINARDAMPDGGSIVVETANVEIEESPFCQKLCIKPGRYVLLTVSDTGPGLDPEIQSRIFEPYFSTKAAGKGTGLGLSTVYAVVGQCGGAIGVDSQPGAGTTFKVYLPQCGAVPPATEQGRAEQLRGGTETILLVEDSAALRGLMRRILQESGYAVLESGDPAEALRMAEEYAGPLGLLVADLVLPGFSGSILAERVTSTRPETKVLYTSGFNQESAVQFQQMGPDCVFLEKPFSRADLLAKVRQLLDLAH